MSRKRSKYNDDIPGPDRSLRYYQQKGYSLPLVRRHSRRIFQLARLAKGTYERFDSQFRWFYGLFVKGTDRSFERLSKIQDRVFEGMVHQSLGDCYNQAVMYYLTQADSWKQKSHFIRFTNEIRQTLGWRMFHWVSQQVKQQEDLVDHTVSYTIELNEEDQFPELFKLDLRWILNGDKNGNYLFKGLTPYERYLIYLYFVEGQSLRDIAKTVCVGKDKINENLRRILKQCEENFNQTLDPDWALESPFPLAPE